MEKNNNSKIIFYFIGKPIIPLFKGYKVLEQIYNFETTEVTVANDFFGNWKEKKLIEFQLILKEEFQNKKTPCCFQFYIYYGKNKVYCLIDYIWSYLFDICCLDNKIKISYENEYLEEFNYLDNDKRSRIVIINASPTITINDSKNICSYLPPNTIKNNSFQVSFFDSSLDAYSSKAILNEEINGDITFVETLRDKKDILKKFYEDLKDLIKAKQENVEIYKDFIASIDLQIIKTNFSIRKDILKKEFNDDELYDLFYLYILWYICDIKYFSNKYKEKNKEGRNEEDVEFQCTYKIDIIFKYITNFYERYKKDKDLLCYQRVLLLYSNTLFFIQLNNEEKYNNSELDYINVKNVSSNSVFGLNFKFLNEFINGLNSESALFYPLLLLDSGVYYHRDKSIYGFDFQNYNIIKAHLRELIPDILFIYKYATVHNEKGFNFKGIKTIFINKFTILKGYKGVPQKDDSDIKKVKHYAMRTSIIMMYECFGHNKYLCQENTLIDSPQYFYNQDKQLIKIIPKTKMDINISNEKTIFINKENNIDESGKLFKYFFGLYGNELVIDLIYSISDISKLIENVNYFVSDSLDLLKKYIIYKYTLDNKIIKFQQSENRDLKEDIIEMEQVLRKYNINTFEKISFNEGNKKDEESTIFSVEMNEKEIKNFSYYLKRMTETKDRNEARRCARAIIYKYLKQE